MLSFKFRGVLLLSSLCVFLLSCTFTEKTPILHTVKKPSTADLIHALTKKISLNPNDFDAYFNRATLYYQQKNYQQARFDYQKTILLHPLFVDAYGMLGWISITQGEFSQAENYCREAYQLDRTSVEWTLNLAHISLLRGKTKNARFYYKKALKLIPNQTVFEDLVIADFEFFIQKGWKVKLIHDEKRRMSVNFAKKLQTQKKYSL